MVVDMSTIFGILNSLTHCFISLEKDERGRSPREGV